MKICFIQELIDKIRNKSSFDMILLDKWVGYQKLSDIKTLVLGSSHLQNGFYATEGEYNFAISSQDLYYGYNLYKILNRPTIKNIVISFSVFTPGLSIIKTKQADFCLPYKTIMNIEYQNKEDAEIKNLFKLEKKHQKKLEKYQAKLSLKKDYRGNLAWYPHKKFFNTEAKERALKHYKNNQRENSQMNYCEKLISDARKNNQNIYFILPPATIGYREALPNKDELFKSLFELVEKYNNAKVLNYYDTDLFNADTDFTNEDHLNKQGAIKLSELIRKEIYK